MLNIFEMLGASFFLVLGLMSILWVVYLYSRNAGVVDIGWALGFVLTSWAYFFLGEGDLLKRLTITILATVWALRLAWQFYHRFVLAKEDPRYEEIRRSWGNQYLDFKFLMMFIFQGVLVVFLSLPFLIVCSLGIPNWHPVEIVAILLWVLGVGGETVADIQLTNFKKNSENQKKVCQEGLWRYSRHPNYFFEFVVWVSFFLFALGTPGGWLSVISPGLMLCLLLKISGIPLTEAEALRSKGAEYEEYMRKTSPFIPWFSRENKGD
jgi:steroid 5-alpha reductase family enzyme